MGHRSWMVAIEDDQDAVAVKRWLLNVEAANKVDWGLTYHNTCIRKDGSVWALIDSDGSGVINHLMDFGYVPSGDRILLLGEVEGWDDEDGVFGAFKDALHTAYLDAEEHEFLPAGSRALADQFGEVKLLLTADLAELAKVKAQVEGLARKVEPRLVPHIGSTYYSVTESGAQLLGLKVHHLSAEFIRHMNRELDVQALEEGKIPGNARSGFQIGDSNTVTVYEDADGCYLSWPLVGSQIGDDELIEMAQANKAERFRARAGKMLAACGYMGGYGGFSGPDETSRDWHKTVTAGQDRIHLTASCKSRRAVNGDRKSAYINCVEVSTWTSYGAGQGGDGAGKRLEITEAGLDALSESVGSFEKAVLSSCGTTGAGRA